MNTPAICLQMSPAELVEEAIKNQEGVLTDTGALMCDTGDFTGRSPQDKFLVMDSKTENTVWWGDINNPFDSLAFDRLHQKMLHFLADKKQYVRYAYAGADPRFRLNLKIINTWAWHNLFCHNMFIRPQPAELENFQTDFTIICIPEFLADPDTDGTRSSNFSIINLTKKVLLIGGTGYAGEMKKGIFTVMNYLLPQEHQTLSMHCSANVGEAGDTAIFFGLSGTGKTTLSTDSDRYLIGDDEHGWADTGVFNFEGGCYAKVINLTPEKEPEIYQAIRFGAIVENTRFLPNTHTVDYTNKSVTQNTRTSYPIDYIPKITRPSVGGTAKNIFFLTSDSFGVLPPISKLDKGQAMFHFISGYTAKVAGTEMGVLEPQATFSACFGAAFLPLHPTQYAALLGKKIEENQVHVWLINTGWVGGVYGVGERIKLAYTRAMIRAALAGALNDISYQVHPLFGVMMPTTCPDVPTELLNPEISWKSVEEYRLAAQKLAQMFQDNFQKYLGFANEDILAGMPKTTS